MEDSYRRRPRPYPAEQARQGYIVLNTPARRIIFISGLVGIALLLIVLAVLN